MALQCFRSLNKSFGVLNPGYYVQFLLVQSKRKCVNVFCQLQSIMPLWKLSSNISQTKLNDYQFCLKQFRNLKLLFEVV